MPNNVEWGKIYEDVKTAAGTVYGDATGGVGTLYEDGALLVKTAYGIPEEIISQLKGYDEEPKIVDKIYKQYFDDDGKLLPKQNKEGKELGINRKLVLYYYDTYVEYDSLLLSEKSKITGIQSEWVKFKKKKEDLKDQSLDAQSNFEEINEKIAEKEKTLKGFGDIESVKKTLTGSDLTTFTTYVENLEKEIEELKGDRYENTNPKVQCNTCDIPEGKKKTNPLTILKKLMKKSEKIPLDDAIKMLEEDLKPSLEKIMDYHSQKTRAYYHAKKYKKLAMSK